MCSQPAFLLIELISVAVTMGSLILMLLLLLNAVSNNGNAQKCQRHVEQPRVNSIEPLFPRTTGTDAALGTRYTITGKHLDKVSEISVERETSFGPEKIPLVDSVRESASINFYLDTAVLPPGGTKATVLVIPTNPDCSTLSLAISLYDPSK